MAQEFNKMYTPEDIYDIEKYVLLGEIDDSTSMGRWSLGYYYSENDDEWYVAFTKGNNNRFLTPCDSREAAIDVYKIMAEDYRVISQHLNEKKSAGLIRTHEELKEEFFKQQTYRVLEKRKRKKEQKQQLAEEKLRKIQEIMDERAKSYVDFTAHFSREIAGFERRTDYLWIAENGDLVFQGEFCHLNDCYLIATKVHNIRPYYKEIKALIKDYCQKGIGHSISSDCEDGTPYRRKIKGYIRVEINLETLTEKEIIRLYENTLKNKKFPDENKKRSIKKELDLYDERMSESHL